MIDKFENLNINSPSGTVNQDFSNYNSAKQKPKVPPLDFSTLNSKKSQKVILKEQETIKKINQSLNSYIES